MEQTYELVVGIVPRGMGEKVVAAAVEAGAKGSTILSGRGSGSVDVKKIFGLAMEHEKDVVLVASPADISNNVADVIGKVADVEKPGTGIVLVLPIKRGLGLSKLISSATM
ncbi:P-II family nitrogen regulator [Desulfovibrio sp. OttesenSCG-928-C06]|nr:P-II family nitrogen regulator [Desulfovibrio sp. OttesenSCG-928-C06]